ncbi:hypothetical protein SUGI_0216040 [Cryptomeria japonica]|nr:hypothetical protein SUGI_0216040 [Cryptomeria japonica]
MDVDEKEATLLAVEIVAEKGDNTIEREDESTLGYSSRALYYVAYGVVPFGWESKPETPKHCLNLGDSPPRSLHKGRSRLKPYLPDSMPDLVKIFSSMFGGYVSMGKIAESMVLVMMEEDQKLSTYRPHQIPNLLAPNSQSAKHQNTAKTEFPRVPLDSPLTLQWYKLEDQKGDIMLAVWMGTQATLQRKSENPDARLADYVDVAICTGVEACTFDHVARMDAFQTQIRECMQLNAKWKQIHHESNKSNSVYYSLLLGDNEMEEPIDLTEALAVREGVTAVEEFSVGRGDEKLLEEEWFEEFPLFPVVQTLMQTIVGISEDTAIRKRILQQTVMSSSNSSAHMSVRTFLQKGAQLGTTYESRLLKYDPERHLVVFWVSCEAGAEESPVWDFW